MAVINVQFGRAAECEGKSAPGPREVSYAWKARLQALSRQVCLPLSASTAAG